MFYDSLVLARIAADIRRQALGAAVDRVFAFEDAGVALELRRRLPRNQVVLSWSPELARAHLDADREPRPDLHSPFADSLRKHLRGALLADCQQVAFDRLLRLEFANCGGLGPHSRVQLLAEIMGRRANLVLVGDDGRIISCARHVTHRVNRYRETMPGVPYVPPPDFGRLDPRAVTPESLRHAAVGRTDPVPQLRELLRDLLMGTSDLFLDEVLIRASLSGGADTVPPHWPDRVAAALSALLEEAEAPGPGFLYADPHDASRSFAYPVVLQSATGAQVSRHDDLSAALAIVAGAAQEAGGKAPTRRRDHLLARARQALERARARVQERRRALAEAMEADGLRRQGELLLAHLHAIVPGANEAVVPDYYQPGQPAVTIPLDPRKSAQENAQALFARYKRALRAQEHIPRLLAQAERECEYLEGLAEQIEAAEGRDELDQIEAELSAAGYLPESSRSSRPLPVLQRAQPRRFTSSDGYLVLYGKTGAQNDALVRAADGDDLWFHVAQGPGGHVLIRTGGRPHEVPRRTIEEAAAAAAALSRWRTDRRALVHYTLARHVRKPKGAPPGLVTCSHLSSLTVTPIPPPQ